MVPATSTEAARVEAEAASGPMDWGALSPEILQQVTALFGLAGQFCAHATFQSGKAISNLQVGARLSRATIPTARLVCTAWAAGIALGVTHLRPRLTGASGPRRLGMQSQYGAAGAQWGHFSDCCPTQQQLPDCQCLALAGTWPSSQHVARRACLAQHEGPGERRLPQRHGPGSAAA